MSIQDTVISEILDFWFGPVERWKLPKVTNSQELWFMGTPEIDALIQKKFRHYMDEASTGRLDSWTATPEGCLALILLLDQFSLNVFRDQPRSFTAAHLALPYALTAIREKQDQAVPPMQRAFFYLPLEHAEDIHLQKEAVELFKTLIEAADPADRTSFENAHDYAIRHLRVIERFGRFPDRNPVLGRTPTSAERKYMDDGGPDF